MIRKPIHPNRKAPSHDKTTTMYAILLLAQISQFWYAIPLIVAVSLTYAATRHELIEPILRHAVRIGVWIVGFMTVVFAVLLLISSLV